MIRKPLKAPSKPLSDADLAHIIKTHGQVVMSPKLDGFRCLIQEAMPKTSSLKMFPNLYVNDQLSSEIYEGFDGELVVGAYDDPMAFNNSTGPLRREAGKPDFTFWVFDDFMTPEFPYEDRLAILQERVNNIDSPHIKVLEYRIITCLEEAMEYDAECVGRGFEGSMARLLDKPYKHGRATFNEAIIFKRKTFIDIDCRILGMVEGTTNMNEAKIDEMGHQKRSSHKENKVPNGTLGAFILQHPNWETPFQCGGWDGGTDELRQEAWDNKDELIGTWCTIKYQPHGSIDGPRLPIFLRFRPDFDITED